MIDPAKLHPYERGGRKAKGIPLTAGNIGILKTVFVDPPRRTRKAGRNVKEHRP